MDINLILTLICCFSIPHLAAWRSFYFRFESVQCSQSSNLTSHLNCSLTKNKLRQESLCLNLKFATVLNHPKLDLVIQAYRKKQKEFTLVNATDFDGCQFLQNQGSFSIMRILRNEFENYAKLPNKCPVEKDTEIHVKNLILDAEKFPPYVPEMKFSARVRLFEGKTSIFQLVINGSAESKNRVKPAKTAFVGAQ